MPGLAPLFASLRAAILTTAGSSEDTLSMALSSVSDLRAAHRPELRDALRVLGFVHRIRGDFALARKAYEEAAERGDRSTQLGLALVTLA
jgi:hypothetical protein